MLCFDKYPITNDNAYPLDVSKYEPNKNRVYIGKGHMNLNINKFWLNLYAITYEHSIASVLIYQDIEHNITTTILCKLFCVH